MKDGRDDHPKISAVFNKCYSSYLGGSRVASVLLGYYSPKCQKLRAEIRYYCHDVAVICFVNAVL